MLIELPPEGVVSYWSLFPSKGRLCPLKLWMASHIDISKLKRIERRKNVTGMCFFHCRFTYFPLSLSFCDLVH